MTEELNVRIVRALPFTGNRETWNHQGMLYPYNTLYFVEGGDGHIRLNGKTKDMKSGYAYLIPPHCQHDVWCDSSVEKVYVDVHVELLPGYDVFSETNTVLERYVGIECCRRIRAKCQGGLREHLAMRGEVEIVLAEFMTEEPKQVSAKMAAYIPLITYMQQHLSAQLRRDELADKFNFHPTILSRSFKQVFGCGWKQYVEKLLTARIAEELLLTEKTLQELADEYGFCDGYYLSSFFKRRMGMSPLTYRKKFSR